MFDHGFLWHKASRDSRVVCVDRAFSCNSFASFRYFWSCDSPEKLVISVQLEDQAGSHPIMAWFWGSKPDAENASANAAQADKSSSKDTDQTRSGCPVMMGSKKEAESSPSAAGCPVSEEHRRDHPMIFLDPRNNMKAGGESQ
jgi:hypothetical protein